MEFHEDFKAASLKLTIIKSGNKVIYNPLNPLKVKLTILECNCRSWCDVSVQHTQRSKRYCDIPAPSASDRNKRLQSGIAA